MKIRIPKRASQQLLKRIAKLQSSIENGTAQFRSSRRYNYRTIALGHCERAVLLNDTLHIFSQHSDYEKFVNRAH
ncbi:hypothetical protein [Vibrio mediterranei]|uniref:hypothetical protein n=1 Tax=Vibrio mediterranei TaxID=689 RepID=UPI004067B5B0